MKWLKNNFKNIVVFAGPIIFEIANQVTGDWVKDGKVAISIGKFITILIGITYFIVLSYTTYKEKKDENVVTNLRLRLKKLEKKNDVYNNNAKSLCDILSYTTEKTRNQISDFGKKKEIDTSFINATNAATIVCECIYKNIIELLEQHQDVTVNYYRKYIGEDGKKYTEMIAHEGYNTTPKYYMIARLLKIDKKSYYCEKLLDNNNPDIVFLPTKEEVAKAFGIQTEKCKYNQYAGIPIRRYASNEKVALIEIVAHNNSIIWNDIEEVRAFVQCHCGMFEEYFLLIDMLVNLYGTVNKYQVEKNEENQYERSIEVQ